MLARLLVRWVSRRMHTSSQPDQQHSAHANPVEITELKKILQTFVEVQRQEGNEERIGSRLDPFMPAKATPIELIALAEALEDSPSDAAHLVRRFWGQSEDLPSVLKAARQLGFVRRERESILLTDLGRGFVRASDGKIRIIRAGLCRLQPFRATLELLSSKKSVSADDVHELLCNKDHSWRYPPNLTKESLQTMLIEWGVSSGLLSYDGKTRRFHLA